MIFLCFATFGRCHPCYWFIPHDWNKFLAYFLIFFQIILSLVRFMASNKTARLGVFCYMAFLHALVFVVVYSMALTDVCKRKNIFTWLYTYYLMFCVGSLKKEKGKFDTLFFFWGAGLILSRRFRYFQLLERATWTNKKTIALNIMKMFSYRDEAAKWHGAFVGHMQVNNYQ